ncbi:MAG: hypothetical protein QW577_04785 [Candidatus Bathyarchaeia archaeon]
MHLPSLAKLLGVRAPKTLEELITAGAFEEVEKMFLDASRNIIDKASLPVKDVRLLAPIANPQKLFASD